MRQLILLTATVQPNTGSGNLSVTDPEERQEQYLSAFWRLFRAVPAGVEGFVVAENSGADLAEFRQVAADAECPVPVEFVEVPALAVEGDPGRAFLEVHLIHDAMMKSDLVDDDALVWKVTGRYTVPNLGQIIAPRPGPVDLCFNVRHYPKPWADMFVFGATLRGITHLHLGVDQLREDLNDSWERCAEHAMFDLLFAAAADGVRVDPRFPVEPRLSGIRGWDGRSYESPKQWVKYAVRAGARVVAPKVWL